MNATMMTTKDADYEGLRAERLADGWCVVQGDHARWWPDEDLQEELDASATPEDLVLMACLESKRGKWRW